MILQRQSLAYKTVQQCNALLHAYLLNNEVNLLVRVVHKLRPFLGAEHNELYSMLDNEYISLKTSKTYVCFNKDYKSVQLSYPMCRLMVENIRKGY